MFPFVYEINLAGWFHLVVFGLLIPAGAFIQWRKFGKPDSSLPNRLLHFQSTALTIVMLGALSLMVARWEGLQLFPRLLPSWRAIGAGVLMFIGALAYMRPRWRRAVERRARVVYLYMPANATERLWWIVVAVLAGVGEEITWRGVQAGLIQNLTDSFWLAAIICAISFGIGHMIQGTRSVIVVVVFALGFHTLVWLSGSLYVAMAVHIAYDITAGISYGRLGREMGYQLDPGESPAPAPSITDVNF